MGSIMQMRNINLVNIYEPGKVAEEISILFEECGAQDSFAPCSIVFKDIEKLFMGTYPGYRGCTTQYHDLKHTMYTVLAMGRLMHGAYKDGVALTPRMLLLGVVSALFHDTGYIQEDSDTEGTGAKYTQIHVDRSIVFMQKYFAEHGYTNKDADYCAGIILHTKLAQNIAEICETGTFCKQLGNMLGSADLLSQMGDRTYLEKLLFLYYEFQEGGIAGFNQEFDILKNTLDFYNMAQKRLHDDLGRVCRYMRTHFRCRWDIDSDLYSDAMESNIVYLKEILSGNHDAYRQKLRRDGIVDALGKDAS